MPDYLIAIDQGTTSTRAIVFDAALAPVASAQQELRQIYPAPGLVEHDPEEIWSAALATVRAAMARAGAEARDIAALGITNQRETTIIWDRATNRPIHNAIVWQDRRTADRCEALRQDEPMIAARTGLLLDPYFSATKIAWLLDHVEGARVAAREGRLAFGTVDSFLLWRLTGGKVHASDATNASRTLLLDIHRGSWDAELCRLFDVPEALLPQVRDCAGDFGTTELFGGPIRIQGRGHQQAAMVGQRCFAAVDLRHRLLRCQHRRSADRVENLLTTIAYRLVAADLRARRGDFASAAVQWLRDAGVIGAAPDVNALCRGRGSSGRSSRSHSSARAPWWDANARGALFGLTPRQEWRSLPAPRSRRWAIRPATAPRRAGRLAAAGTDTVLRVDGGMAASDLTMQFVADILAAPVDRPGVMETTALGAAYLAGYAAGVCPDLPGFAARWRCERRFEPQMGAITRERKWAGWRDAVARTLS